MAKNLTKCGERADNIVGETIHLAKNFSRFYVELASALRTGMRVLARTDGAWEEQFTDDRNAVYFSFTDITFQKFSFSCDRNPKTIGQKIRIKKVDKAGFKVENGELNEPFGMNDITIEYVETGYFK